MGHKKRAFPKRKGSFYARYIGFKKSYTLPILDWRTNTTATTSDMRNGIFHFFKQVQ